MRVLVVLLTVLGVSTAHANLIDVKLSKPIELHTTKMSDTNILTALEAMGEWNKLLSQPMLKLGQHDLPTYMAMKTHINAIVTHPLDLLSSFFEFFQEPTLALVMWELNPFKPTELLHTTMIFPSDFKDPHRRETVMIHELGHVLGLPHVGNPDDIMYPANTGLPQRLTYHSLALLAHKYPLSFDGHTLLQFEKELLEDAAKGTPERKQVPELNKHKRFECILKMRLRGPAIERG